MKRRFCISYQSKGADFHEIVVAQSKGQAQRRFTQKYGNDSRKITTVKEVKP